MHSFWLEINQYSNIGANQYTDTDVHLIIGTTVTLPVLGSSKIETWCKEVVSDVVSPFW